MPLHYVRVETSSPVGHLQFATGRVQAWRLPTILRPRFPQALPAFAAPAFHPVAFSAARRSQPAMRTAHATPRPARAQFRRQPIAHSYMRPGAGAAPAPRWPHRRAPQCARPKLTQHGPRRARAGVVLGVHARNCEARPFLTRRRRRPLRWGGDRVGPARRTRQALILNAILNDNVAIPACRTA